MLFFFFFFFIQSISVCKWKSSQTNKNHILTVCCTNRRWYDCGCDWEKMQYSNPLSHYFCFWLLLFPELKLVKMHQFLVFAQSPQWFLTAIHYCSCSMLLSATVQNILQQISSTKLLVQLCIIQSKESRHQPLCFQRKSSVLPQTEYKIWT